MANAENIPDNLNTGESEETTTVRKKLGRPSLNPTETVREMARQMFTGLQDTDIGKAINTVNRSLDLMEAQNDRIMSLAESVVEKLGSLVVTDAPKPAIATKPVAEAKKPVADGPNAVDDAVTAVGDAVSASVPTVKATRKRVWY